MKYYSAKTVTKILGVTAQTLRNWDKEGKLKPSYVKSNGYRYYSIEQLETMLFIKRLKSYNFSLEKIKIILKSEELKEEKLYSYLIKNKEKLINK